MVEALTEGSISECTNGKKSSSSMKVFGLEKRIAELDDGPCRESFPHHLPTAAPVKSDDAETQSSFNRDIPML